MQKIYPLFCLSLLLTPLCFLSGQSPSSQNNYIYIQEPLDYVQDISQSEETIRSVQYFDGLGRPEQSIMIQATPEQKDIVTKIEYDGFGRQAIDYLPVPSEQSSGEFIDNLNGNYYYDTFGENTWYSEMELENSPLNRVFRQAAPGEDWRMDNGKEIKFQYKTNTAQEVRLFKVNSAGSLTESGKYAAGQLYKTIVIDENGNAIHEFKDKMGRVVLKRTFVAEGSPAAGKPNPKAEQNKTVDTYYVYDKFGNLSFVIPPLAAENSSVTQAHLDELCYLYRYDDKNRLIEKKLPGKGWEYMVYDRQDRLVAVQDANLKAQSKWLFTKYDKFGRVVYTGMVIKSKDRSDLQLEVNNFGANNEIRNGSFNKNGNTIYYTKTAFPTSFEEVLTVIYYDEYTGNYQPPNTVFGQSVLKNIKGLPTDSDVKIIGKAKWEKTRMVYDKKARPILSEKSNHSGGYTKVETKLDFRGKPVRSKTYHKRLQSDDEIVIEETFNYDNAERLKNHNHRTGTGTFQILARNEYDEVGQLVVKGVGGQVLDNDRWQNINYKYNIRGWLTDINNVQNPVDGEGSFPPTANDDLFALKIRYNTVNIMGSSTPTKLYNGNISQIVWKSGTDNIQRGYTYTYDQLNRLRSADFYKEGNPTMTAYGEYIEYDINGNIKSLYRTTGDELENEIVMDDLAYAYFTHSNRLKNVRDVSGNSSGFADGNDHSSSGLDDYAYDDNGNLTKDRNKGITEITYNHLNLPVKISFESGDYIEYAYNAVGEKVSKTVRAGDTQKIVDYRDGFQYAGGVLQFFPHAEGYVNATHTETASGSVSYIFDYVFNHTDHLGNIRVTYTKDPQTGALEIMEENHYYPFGLKHEVYSSLTPKGFSIDNELGRTKLITIREDDYKYKYNGKEWQDELNMNWYDYGARNYDPALGRWMNLDPLAEKFMSVSPYNYALNNPVVFVDPDGMEARTGDSTTKPDEEVEDIDMVYNIGYGRTTTERSRTMAITGSRSVVSLNSSDGGKNSPNQNPSNGDHKQVLKNDSLNPENVIYFKPEGNITVDGKEYKNGGAYPLKPGEMWEHGFDGVAAPHIAEGIIYKVSNGVSLTVSDNTVTWSGGGNFAKLAMYAGNLFPGSNYTGGWKTEPWLRDLTASSVTTITTSWKTGVSNQSVIFKKSDKSWINLFDKSGLKSAKDYHQPHTIYRKTGGF